MMVAADWTSPLSSRCRRPARRSVTKRVFLWVGWSRLALTGNVCVCGRDVGFLFAPPRTIRRDRKGSSWESIGPVVGRDRGGRFPRAWGIDPSERWSRVGYASAWGDLHWCRCSTCPSTTLVRWGMDWWWDGKRRRRGRGGLFVLVVRRR